MLPSSRETIILMNMGIRAGQGDQSDPPACAFVTERARGADVVRVFGEIDLCNAAQLKSAILRIAESGGDVVLDLTSCKYMDSSGLGALVVARRAHAPRVHLVVPRRGSIHRIFEITGLAMQFKLFETIAEALAAIPQTPAARPPASDGLLPSP